MIMITNGLISVIVRCRTENIQEKMGASITKYNLDFFCFVLYIKDWNWWVLFAKRQKDRSFWEPRHIIWTNFFLWYFFMAKNLLARRTTNLAVISRPMLNLVASGLGLALISKTDYVFKKEIMYPQSLCPC
jgi:hypothetical protein